VDEHDVKVQLVMDPVEPEEMEIALDAQLA
jgi:hypothetical protein